MPRIEIIPAGWENSKEKAAGDGTPTEDVCMNCFNYFHMNGITKFSSKGSVSAVNFFGRPYKFGDTIGEIDVEHPPYEDDDCQCAICGETLTDND